MVNSICLLKAVVFLDLLAVSLIMPLIPRYTRQLGASHMYIGLLGSIYAGFQLGSGPIIGSLSDLKGRRSILIGTLLVCSVAYTLLGFTTSVLVILFIRAVLGLFKQTQMLARALVPDYEKDENKQSALYGHLAAISGCGMALGPTIGGHVVENDPENGFTVIAVVVGICFVLNAGLVYLLPDIKKKPSKKSSSTPKGNKSVLSSLTNSLKQSCQELFKVQWSEFWQIFLLKAFIGFAMGVYYSNYAIYLKVVFDLTPKYTGYVVSFQAVIGVISSYFISYISKIYHLDHDFSQRNLHVFICIAFSLVGLTVSWNIYVYSLFLIPLAIGNAIGRLVTLEMILKRSHGDNRGTLIGASNSVRSLTGVVSPMVAGLIGEYVGVPYVIYAAIFSTLLGVYVSYNIRQISIIKEKDE